MSTLKNTAPLIAVDEHTVWLQANRRHGAMVPSASPEWRANRDRMVAVLGRYTQARQLVRMWALGVSGYKDLGDSVPADTFEIDGLITTSPDVILHANPADCGEIAVAAYSRSQQRPVIGLFHASRRIVGEGGHLQALDYLTQHYGVEPSGMQVRLGPSARKPSYRLAYLEPDMRHDPAWRDYIKQGSDGLWEVDFHQRTVDELQDFGILADNLAISDIDTMADDRYFSNRQYQQGHQPRGYNGLFFALRTR